jgi:hypothetical protein
MLCAKKIHRKKTDGEHLQVESGWIRNWWRTSSSWIGLNQKLMENIFKLNRVESACCELLHIDADFKAGLWWTRILTLIRIQFLAIRIRIQEPKKERTFFSILLKLKLQVKVTVWGRFFPSIFFPLESGYTKVLNPDPMQIRIHINNPLQSCLKTLKARSFQLLLKNINTVQCSTN